jgi:hypothetical protein
MRFALASLVPSGLSFGVVVAFALGCGGGATPPVSMPPEVVPAASATPTAPTATPAVEGRVTAEQVVASSRDGLDKCWDDARASWKGMPPMPQATTVDITFDIETDGVPHQVHLDYKHRLPEDAKECLRQAALAVKFPDYLAGKPKVPVSFPRR